MIYRLPYLGEATAGSSGTTSIVKFFGSTGGTSSTTAESADDFLPSLNMGLAN